MTTTNANCYKPPFPPCEGGLSQITNVTNPNGSITYTHTDWEWGPAVSWTVWGASSVLSANNDLWIDTLWNIQTGYPLVRDTYTNSAGFIREFNNNVHFNIGDGITNIGNNSLGIGANHNITAALASVNWFDNDVSGNWANVWGIRNTVSWVHSWVVWDWNDVQVPYGYTWGRNNEVIWNWFSSVTYWQNNAHNSALSSIGWFDTVWTGTSGRNIVNGDRNSFNNLVASIVSGSDNDVSWERNLVVATDTVVDGNNIWTNAQTSNLQWVRIAAFWNMITTSWVDSLLNWDDLSDGGFLGTTTLGQNITAIRDFQTHIDWLWLNIVWRNRVFANDGAAWTAWLVQWEVYGDSNGFLRYKL